MKIVYIISWVVSIVGLFDLMVFKHPRWGWNFDPSGAAYNKRHEVNSDIFRQMSELDEEFNCLYQEWHKATTTEERRRILKAEEEVIKKKKELHLKLILK